MNTKRRFLSIGFIVCGLVFLGSVLSAKPSDAATYYVAKTGSNSHTCTQAQSTSTPKLTLQGASGAFSCLGTATGAGAGHVIEILDSGTYAEQITTPPGGTSWSSPFTLRASSGQSPQIKPTASVTTHIVQLGGDERKYIIFDGLIIDGSNVQPEGHCVNISTRDGVPAHHIRFQNGVIRNCKTQGVIINALSSSNEFINMEIHNNGTPGDRYEHGLYVCGTGNIIERSRIHHNSGHGYHGYNSSNPVCHNNIVRNNLVYNNGSRGILIGSGNGNLAYNNIIYNNGFTFNGQGISIGFAKNNSNRAYNNTIYGNYACIEVRSGETDAEVKNNICWKNSSDTISDSGSGTIKQANLLGLDPLFVSISNLNFNLQAASKAIDAGVSASMVTNDYAGTLRPQGGAYDIGAYEYAITVKPPSNLRISSNQ